MRSQAVAAAALSQLGALQKSGVLVAPALLDTARLLDKITRFDSAELRVVHENAPTPVAQLGAAAD